MTASPAASPPRERAWERPQALPTVQRLALAATFVALGVVLSTLSIPVGPARVFPFQHMLNVIAGVLLGPAYAVLTAFAISVLRNAFGTGTFLAFPGSMFGALLVGLAYHRVRRTDLVALLEPVGTALIGALVGYALIAPLAAPEMVLGFIRANPPSGQPYLGIFGGAAALVASFAVSSVPGAVLGYLCLAALRRAGVVGGASRPAPAAPGAAHGAGRR